MQELENFSEIQNNVIYIDGKSFVQVNWGEDEINFIPEDYYMTPLFILYYMTEETEYGWIDGAAYPELFSTYESALEYYKNNR